MPMGGELKWVLKEGGGCILELFMLQLLTAHEGFSGYIKHTARGCSPRAVLLIYQLKPEGAVNNWLLAHLRLRFNVLLSIRKEPMLSGFLTLNAQSILHHTGIDVMRRK